MDSEWMGVEAMKQDFCTAAAGKGVVRMLRTSACVALTSVMLVPMCGAEAPPIIAMMAANELASRQHAGHFSYTSEEKSERTGMHVWREHVVEVGDGMLRRLVAVDGRALSPAETQAETQRLETLVRNPAEFHRQELAHKDDESHATKLLQLLPRAFLMTPDGTRDGCTQFRFVPNPEFKPSSYEERVGAALAGTVSLMESSGRLCILQGTVSRPVMFGFGIIGKINPGGSFRLERVPVAGAEWKTRSMSVHMGGKILMKSLAKEQETTRSEIRKVPENLTLAQAIGMLPS
jgi:hypothetical protein